MELEILWDLWVPCLFYIELIYINKGTEGPTEQIFKDDITDIFTSTNTCGT